MIIEDYNINNINDNKSIDNALGTEFFLRKSFNFNKSGALEVDTLSPIFQYQMKFPQYDLNVEVEIRPKGIVVYLNNTKKSIAWIIPYYKLVIFQSRYYGIHSNGHFIRFYKQYLSPDQSSFFKKILEQKAMIQNLNRL